MTLYHLVRLVSVT